MKYYTLDAILKKNALYNVIFGERSNGKTFAVLNYALKKYFEDGSELAIIRRMDDDFKSKRGSQMFANLVNNNLVYKYSSGEYNTIDYYAGRWFLARNEEGKSKRSEIPFAYAFSLSTMEHDKSSSYPNIRNILFDEFTTRSYYLPDEFVLFMNTLSTIIRERTGVKIFMCGNTVNKYCPYYGEMGLTHVKEMKQGTIDVYTYGESDLTVAVEYADSTKGGKKSDVYFAFNNPKLKMITNGDWEIDIYPHLPAKYKRFEVVFIYFIEFDDELLQCEVINQNEGCFTFIHRKTTPIKDEDSDILFSNKIHSQRPNMRRRLTMPYDKIGEKIYSFYKNDKVFYQSNDVGEVVRNYLMWSQKGGA